MATDGKFILKTLDILCLHHNSKAERYCCNRSIILEEEELKVGPVLPLLIENFL